METCLRASKVTVVSIRTLFVLEKLIKRGEKVVGLRWSRYGSGKGSSGR